MAAVDQRTHLRRHAMIAQPAGMDGGRHKRMTQRIHLTNRRDTAGVGPVPGEGALGEGRTGGRLNRDDTRVFALLEFFSDKGKGKTGKIRPAPGAADDNIRVFAGHFHLQQSLFTDNGLM